MKLFVMTSSGQITDISCTLDEPLSDFLKRLDELGITLEINSAHSIENFTVLDYLIANDYVPISNVYCSVPRCSNSKSTNPEKVFFNFPNEQIRCHQWVMYCQKFEEDPGKKRLTLTTNSAICSDHFSQDQFVKNANTLLKRTAVPSLPESSWRKASTENIVDKNKCTPQQTYSNLDRNQDSCKILCRLCANPCSDYIFIFDELGRSLKISEKINLCFPFEVKITDALPKQICRSCLNELNELYQFADLSSMSEHRLMDLFSSDDQNSYSFETCHLCNIGKIVEICPPDVENNPTPRLLPFEDNTEINLNSVIVKMEPAISNELNNDILFEYNNSSSVTSDLVQFQCQDSFSHDSATIMESLISDHVLPSSEQLTFQNAEPGISLLSSMEAAQMSCRICGSEFSDKRELLNHSYEHSCLAFSQCAVCVAFFTNNEDFENHLSLHKQEKHYCSICQKQYSSIIEIHEHLCKPITCSVCFKILANEYSYSSHMKLHEESLYCGLCCLFFTNDVELQKHLLYVHNSRKNHCCSECGKVFKSEASMKYHQRIHQDNEKAKSFTCEWCGKNFLRRSMLVNHLSSFHPYLSLKVECFTCKICHEAFPSIKTSLAHFKNVHGPEYLNDSILSVEISEEQKIFICEYCLRCFSSEYFLHLHRKGHPSESPYECKNCKTTFEIIDDFRTHQMSHLEKDILQEYESDFTITKSYLCEYCERCFIDYNKYIEHLSVHYGPKPYQCYHCPSRFSSFSEAAQHRFEFNLTSTLMEMYDIRRPHQCHFCNKSFSIEDALTKHIRMHTGEKPFICEECGKGFSQSSGLYTHLKVHSSNRPYSCSICPRTFKIKGDRDVHVRKHSGERPYRCEFCGKAFMTQHVYSQHRKIHTGERPYRCDVCGAAFRRSHVLTVHKRIHTGEKPNVCVHCGKRYRQKGDMLKHCRVQHGILNSKSNLCSL